MRNLGLVEIGWIWCLFLCIRIDSVSCMNSDGLVLLSLLKHFDKVPLEVTSTWKNNTSPLELTISLNCYYSTENAYKTVRGKESDVYSYGVVLLELVTGKRAVDRSCPEETDLVSWVRSVLSNYEDDDDSAGPIIDPTLVDELMDTKLREQAIYVTDLALRCTDKRPENRPSMRNVTKELTDVKDLVRSSPGSIQ